MIIKDSEEEGVFVKEVIEVFKEINMSNLSDIEWLEDVVCSLASSIKKIWVKNSKTVNITKHSKSWWSTHCSRDLEKYKLTRSIED